MLGQSYHTLVPKRQVCMGIHIQIIEAEGSFPSPFCFPSSPLQSAYLEDRSSASSSASNRGSLLVWIDDSELSTRIHEKNNSIDYSKAPSRQASEERIFFFRKKKWALSKLLGIHELVGQKSRKRRRWRTLHRVVERLPRIALLFLPADHLRRHRNHPCLFHSHLQKVHFQTPPKKKDLSKRIEINRKSEKKRKEKESRFVHIFEFCTQWTWTPN